MPDQMCTQTPAQTAAQTPTQTAAHVYPDMSAGTSAVVPPLHVHEKSLWKRHTDGAGVCTKVSRRFIWAKALQSREEASDSRNAACMKTEGKRLWFLQTSSKSTPPVAFDGRGPRDVRWEESQSSQMNQPGRMKLLLISLHFSSLCTLSSWSK